MNIVINNFRSPEEIEEVFQQFGILPRPILNVLLTPYYFEPLLPGTCPVDFRIVTSTEGLVKSQTAQNKK